ncbi:3D-(3,5/4)-trihydroxycyclohexane-1,2-dione acylhydrolase (decyclizing) [Halomonas elongata]|uniref:3D-(3,5/4)-trihydroxycyclohexane-1,2-dione acylhydrolase (Decyclizing) n=2 Tax=Halomonas elongata TaxID=2746 RepID=E1VBF9_HALED|nr:3D-(3,5/4)-trihydroxycyclohexane-1,2-dione acylhydrolase (decyclizing) [Halomonas elongata]WBF17883.1 3D-(3,5/4)-trihydroxycyclohexane-1,2-dione acylhydrolase (decyclizing) [Halomonas elongata]WPU46729.1 3D-(3,5/4)-trihydroxycyclohexane-1,2-dione acylhydrolase (decyclizing) [Halomonas elongata DSM 2581]CBV44116.1 3D-(3,5/4)-trihydroxycyclohexane-1,2-dione hydrolase [Halomonas elongata DSM 2581]
MNTIRLTMAQALVKYLAAQRIECEGREVALFEGVFGIFGHGNVAGLGEALYHAREELPTYRAHNEQTMAHAAIAFAKANGRRRMMAATSSIGPGATNMVTAAALAHANRLPILLLPGDTFASRDPDPVLQQVEHFGDPTITVNDCFRPVSRYFDRITRPEQLLTSLPQAIATLLDPEHCGPATLALPQDVQTFAYDYPESFFAPRVHRIRRPQPDPRELEAAIVALARSERPLIIAGGGVHYAGACERLSEFARTHGVPVAETQAGKGALPDTHPCAVGAIGVTGSEAANHLAREADLILAVGTRLQDFTTGSRALFERDDLTLVALNVGRFDSQKHHALPLTGDAFDGLEALDTGLADWRLSAAWQERADNLKREWAEVVARVTADEGAELPTDAQVIGAVNRQAGEDGTVVCAAGGLPGELHKLWRCAGPGSYHVEYGYSCMGYEIAGGLGVKMARPDREVFVMVGDGSYLMHNSELATSVMLGQKLVVVVLDNRGFGCINRLQRGTGGAGFNNLLDDCLTIEGGAPKTDFAAHARALGCEAESVRGIQALEDALVRARQADTTYVIALDTDPLPSTSEGGAWWEVAVPEVSAREPVNEAYASYREAKRRQHR